MSARCTVDLRSSGRAAGGEALLYIVIRGTTDWEDEAKVLAQLPEGFAPLLALWNETFEMPFHLFRSELKKISQLSFSKVVGASVAPLEEVPEGGWIVPSDDDDWFSPDLATVLEANLDASSSGCCWPTRFLEVPIDWTHRLGQVRRFLLSSPPSIWTCTSNNYGVVNESETRTLLTSHVRASRWFDQHPARVQRLAAPLSVQNRNLASMTSLRFRGTKRRGTSRVMLLRKYRRYRRLYASGSLPDGVEWARPYVDLMAKLMDELRPKARDR